MDDRGAAGDAGVRVLVIGYGSIGQRHAANARALGHDVQVFDQVGKTMDAAIADGFCPAEPDAFLAEAVIVATPSASHAHVAGGLLMCGYDGPLLVEKPLGVTSTEAVWSLWPHPTTMVGYNLRWQPQARALRAGLTLAGPVTAARFGLVCNMADWPGHAYGEPLIECSHEIDLALWCGAPDELTAVELDKDWAKLEFSSPEHRVDLCWAAEEPRYRRAWTIESERFNGSAWFDSPQALGEQMYRDELAHFLACAQAGVATECPFTDGLAVLRICEQAKAMAGVPT